MLFCERQCFVRFSQIGQFLQEGDFKINALQSVTECYRVLESITKYYRVLQSITEYYRV